METTLGISKPSLCPGTAVSSVETRRPAFARESLMGDAVVVVKIVRTFVELLLLLNGAGFSVLITACNI